MKGQPPLSLFFSFLFPHRISPHFFHGEVEGRRHCNSFALSPPPQKAACSCVRLSFARPCTPRAASRFEAWSCSVETVADLLLSPSSLPPSPFFVLFILLSSFPLWVVLRVDESRRGDARCRLLGAFLYSHGANMYRVVRLWGICALARWLGACRSSFPTLSHFSLLLPRPGCRRPSSLYTLFPALCQTVPWPLLVKDLGGASYPPCFASPFP